MHFWNLVSDWSILMHSWQGSSLAPPTLEWTGHDRPLKKLHLKKALLHEHHAGREALEYIEPSQNQLVF